MDRGTVVGELRQGSQRSSSTLQDFGKCPETLGKFGGERLRVTNTSQTVGFDVRDSLVN